MIKKLFLFILVIIISTSGFSQEQKQNMRKPDFKEIEKTINDKNSPFFYSTLMKRYKENDTTLTIEEYRYLYYGFSFQTNYSPYGKSSYNDALKKSIGENDMEKIIELEKKVLEEYPFNLRNLNTLTAVLEKKEDTAASYAYYKKLLGVAKAIMSTGDGASDSTAMFVISVEHEYDMIGLLGFKMGGGQALIHAKGEQMDKMTLEKNDENIEFLYFNVDRLFASMKKMFGN